MNENYLGMVAEFREALSLAEIDEVCAAIDAIRALPYEEDAIKGAIGVLVAGVAAGMPLKEITL